MRRDTTKKMMQDWWRTKTSSRLAISGRDWQYTESMTPFVNPAPLTRSKTFQPDAAIHRIRRIGRTVCLLVLVGAAFGLTQSLRGGDTADAQQRGPVMRSVTGKVVDKSEAALKGAVVYLKDDHTLAVKSFIVDDAGSYRFGQLSQSTDYELWAELDGKKSNTRTISSFDNKNEFVINLKLDTGK